MQEVVVGSVVLERSVELIKSKLPDKYKKYLDGLTISVILGVGFSLAYSLDFMSLIGLETNVPYLNSIMTGILMTGGAGIWNSIIEAIQSINGNKEEE